MKQKILIVVGPTASGKSDLAVKLSQKFNGEVISADSRQVYKGLNIGTGKITTTEMEGVPHHLLDVADPKDQFTVVEWRTQAEKAIKEIAGRGKLPIICGGTGFYISTLIDDITLPDVPADEELRKELSNKSKEKLFKLLEETDPERAQELNNSDRNNPRRLIRAIEIAKNSGKKSLQKTSARESSYDPLWIGISLSPEELREKILSRLEKRLDQGMIEEVSNLHAGGLSWDRMGELGLEYRLIAACLQNILSLRDMKERLATEIIHYAKRQMTWFKRNKAIKWFKPEQRAEIEQTITLFLN